MIINECAKMLEEGQANMSDIEKIITQAIGCRIGPFGWADVAGIDVMTDLLEGMFQQTGWERYKPTLLLKRMVESGYLGRKTNKGFKEMFGD